MHLCILYSNPCFTLFYRPALLCQVLHVKNMMAMSNFMRRHMQFYCVPQECGKNYPMTKNGLRLETLIPISLEIIRKNYPMTKNGLRLLVPVAINDVLNRKNYPMTKNGLRPPIRVNKIVFISSKNYPMTKNGLRRMASKII